MSIFTAGTLMDRPAVADLLTRLPA
ncbi:MAG: hypothetical protein K0S19_1327, partial [Geminicoccaceae bacterium]|nr:hypothetical protein [Geminicoccaceae bacterium]